jgi:hypothetical protein
MACRAWMETIATINVLRVKTDIIDVSVPGIRQLARCTVFVQHIPQDRVIGITDDAMQCFPAPAVAAVTRIDGIRIFTRDAAFAIIRRIIQQVFTGHERPGKKPAPEHIPFCIPQSVNGREAGNVNLRIAGSVAGRKHVQPGAIVVREQSGVRHCPHTCRTDIVITHEHRDHFCGPGEHFFSRGYNTLCLCGKINHLCTTDGTVEQRVTTGVIFIIIIGYGIEAGGSESLSASLGGVHSGDRPTRGSKSQGHDRGDKT